MKIKIKGAAPKKAKALCCRIYNSRGLKCPECNLVKITVKEQHHD